MSRSIHAESRSTFLPMRLCAALVALAACSSDKPAALQPSAQAGSGASKGADPAENSTQMAGAAAMMSAAGSGGRSAASNAAAAGAAAGPRECRGLQLPTRALGTPGPFKIGPEAAGLTPYWPTQAWKTETPEKLGFDAAKL